MQLNKCVIVCSYVLQRGNSVDSCLSSSILFKYECGAFVGSELGQGMTSCSGECCFKVMYVE